MTDITEFDYKKVYYKFMNPDENHIGFQYQDGLNIDTNPFNPSRKHCSGGGLYFTEYESLGNFSYFMKPNGYLREVTIPENEPVIKEYSDIIKYKSNKIILGKKILLNSDEALNFLIKSKNNLAFIFIYKYKLAKINHEILNELPDKYLLTDVNIHIIKLKNYMKDESTKTDIDKFIKIQKIIDTGLEINRFITIKLKHILYACVYTHYPDFIEYLHDYTKSYKSENKEFPLLTKEQTIRNINNELNNMYGPGFIEILKERNCIITGSYIISHLTNKSFESNTIDIYTQPSSSYINDVFDRYLDRIGERQKHSYIDIYDMYKYKFYDKNIKNIRIFRVAYNPISYIKKKFDYSFCQIWYDGEKIKSIHPIELIEKNIGFINKFYIDEYNNIEIVDYRYIKKHTDYYYDIITKDDNVVYRIAYIISQYLKYTKRGFNIINIDDVFEMCKNLHLKINKIEIDTDYYIL